MNIQPRLLELTINTDINAFSIKNTELFDAIAEEVDLETVTNQELREIFWIVRKQLSHLNWKDMVKYSVEHLPFGLSSAMLICQFRGCRRQANFPPPSPP